MTPCAERKIIHVDMDAFYASVEQRNNPSLKGKPVVVGGRPDSRGVVSTCSYEARIFGIHSAMSCAEAYRRCPEAVFISPPDFSEYRRVSEQVRNIFRDFTELIEPLSLDEAYLDVTKNHPGESSATRLAIAICTRIKAETGLTASAGVSYNKSLAKIASDWDKPEGLTVIRPNQAEEFLDSLPVSKFWGVGPVTARKMEDLGIHVGADLRSWPLWKLSEAFGKSGPWYYNLARGIDERKVIPTRIRKSLGKERTFSKDVSDKDRLGNYLDKISDMVWNELESKKLCGKTLTVKVEYSEFQQETRSRSLGGPISGLNELKALARELLEETDAGSRAVRLLGVTVSSFPDDETGCTPQLELDFFT